MPGSNAVRKTLAISDTDIVSTPEGDNEFTPEEPIGDTEGLQVPNGSAPSPYDADTKPGEPSGKGVADEMEETVDRLSIGQIMT
jgi:hypothetical protein